MYPALRDESRWVLPEVLAFHASARANQPFVTMVDGDGLTYAEAEAEAEAVADFLASQGIKRGDMVAVMLPNGLDFVRAWLGLGRLGAVMVALNTDLKGAFLEHQLENSQANLAIISPDYADRFAAIASRLSKLKALCLPGGEAVDGFRCIDFNGWRQAGRWSGPMPAAADLACVMYTSGTTGPSKGVLMPHAHCFLFGLGSVDNYAMGPEDRFYIVLPLFHANGLFMQLGATLIAGATAIMRDRFSASAWLNDVRSHAATVTNSLGAVTAFVVAQPPTPHDRDHCLRVVGAAPNPAETERQLRERFGIPNVVSLYGMTEVNIPLYAPLGESRPGTCGRVYARYFEVEIRDPETDRPLPPGGVGEIMVRPKAAFGFMTGYHRMPEKTVEAWRNLWFHTGDAAVMGPDGTVTFVDRMKDCIRRRGENISSFEVEAAITRCPGVKEVAAFAVPDVAGGEDEVMLAVVPEDGATIDPAAVAAHAERELPRYAQPRFIEFVNTLPKTPTAKVQKNALRQRGVGPGTWDRLAR